jgi:hypothetical protein
VLNSRLLREETSISSCNLIGYRSKGTSVIVMMHSNIEVLSTSYKELIDRQDVNTKEACLHLNSSTLA